MTSDDVPASGACVPFDGSQETTRNHAGVLVIDDERGLLEASELTLGSYGFDRVYTAFTGEAALEILGREEIGVVLMDFTMPGLSGFELLGGLISARPEVPVVVVTAIDHIETAVQCMQKGAANYLVKPVRPEELVRVTRNALELHCLRRRNALLERNSQRMESLGRLATGIVHDFKNLLHIVGSSCELAGLNFTQPFHVLRNLERARKAADAATASATRLLAFVRGGSREESVVDLGEELERFRMFFSPLARMGVLVIVDRAEQPLRSRLCADDLHQALLNLCLNAQDAMPQGGTLTLRARLAPAPGEQRSVTVIPSAHEGPLASLEIRDTGHGMDQETLRYMLQTFGTTKASQRAAGLGLSIVQEIVRSRRGGLEVETAPGTGTAFRLLLPLEPA